MANQTFMVHVPLREQRNLNIDSVRSILKTDPNHTRMRLFFGGYDHTEDPIYVEESVKKWATKLLNEHPEVLLYADLTAFDSELSGDDSFMHLLATQAKTIEYVRTGQHLGVVFFIEEEQAKQLSSACIAHANQWKYDPSYALARILHHTKFEGENS